PAARCRARRSACSRAARSPRASARPASRARSAPPAYRDPRGAAARCRRTRRRRVSPRRPSEVLALERHGHAARPAARARQLIARDLQRVLLVRPRLELRPPEEEIVLVDDVIAVLRQLLRRAHIALVPEDDPGRERERVRAVRPLLPLLIDRAAPAAVDRLEIDPLLLQRREQRLFLGIRERALLRQIDRRHRRRLTAALQDHRRIDQALVPADEREDRVE